MSFPLKNNHLDSKGSDRPQPCAMISDSAFNKLLELYNLIFSQRNNNPNFNVFSRTPTFTLKNQQINPWHLFFLATNTGVINITNPKQCSIKRQIPQKKTSNICIKFDPPSAVDSPQNLRPHHDAQWCFHSQRIVRGKWASGNPNEFFDVSLGTLNSEPKRFGWVIHIHDAMGEVWRKFGFSTLLLVPYLEKVANMRNVSKFRRFLEMFNYIFWVRGPNGSHFWDTFAIRNEVAKIW